MKNSKFTLYIEINKLNFIFLVTENDEQDNFKINYKLEAPIIGFHNNSISDLEKVFDTIKKNIYEIERKVEFVFNEVVIILDNFYFNFINISGYKNLNGSQVLRENITYILNQLKSYVEKVEPKKTIIHMFNTNFYLDKKNNDNLPIGLFGDFYSHELSFSLIDKNDYKNLKHIFDKNSLKIKKILFKSFVKGAHTSKTNSKADSFFQIHLGNDSSKIFYFENNSLKFEKIFNFGVNIIIKDISKLTSLKEDIVKTILKKTQFNEKLDEEILEKEFFIDLSFRKIKKKFIYEIIMARIEEMINIIFLKNIDCQYYNNQIKTVFFEMDNKIQIYSLKEFIQNNFLKRKDMDIKFLENAHDEGFFNTASEIVHFGWKKEAIPVTHFKKSIIARFFDAIFG